MGARVEGSQRVSALYVDLALDWLPDCRLIDLVIQVMQEAFSDLLHIIYLVMPIGEEETAQVVDLPSRGGIKSASVQDNNILALLLLLDILKHSDDLALELRQAMVLVVQIVSFCVGYGIVEDLLGGLRYLFRSQGDLRVEVVRDRLLADLRDDVSWDSPRLDGRDPVVKRELALVLHQKLLKFLLLGHFSRRPSFKLNLYDVCKALVLRELAVQRREVGLMTLEEME